MQCGGRKVYIEMLATLERVQSELEGAPEAKTDTEALVRIELATSLAAAVRYLRALAADEVAP
jgi:hypothetical protein